MRTTQNIGLTLDAINWIKKHPPYKTETFIMTQGMFNEDIMGQIYYFKDLSFGPIDSEIILTEIVQAVSWSSGPMIFTHLKAIVKQKDSEEIDMGYFFSWVQNPEMYDDDREVDIEKGHYFV